MGELTAIDRFRAWLVTGPLARAAGFVLELSAALRRWVGGRLGR